MDGERQKHTHKTQSQTHKQTKTDTEIFKQTIPLYSFGLRKLVISLLACDVY